MRGYLVQDSVKCSRPKTGGFWRKRMRINWGKQVLETSTIWLI